MATFSNPFRTIDQGQAGRKNGRHRVNKYQVDDNQTSDKDGPKLVFKAREHLQDL